MKVGECIGEEYNSLDVDILLVPDVKCFQKHEDGGYTFLFPFL